MSILFMVAIAPGFHLFPFRTEKLSPSTPMVLPIGGRVGSRRPIRTAWKDEMIFSSGSRFVSQSGSFLSRLSRYSYFIDYIESLEIKSWIDACISLCACIFISI